MTTNRKVRADFDLTKEYSVDVSKCTEEEKKQVQRAFFDVGLNWARMLTDEDYQYLDAMLYTNTSSGGIVTQSLLVSSTTWGYNMSPAEFLELVYEPKQHGHVHAELLAQYAEDAKTTDKPWELWEMKLHFWVDCHENPTWQPDIEYRRKPTTHTVNGVEVPDLRIKPKVGDRFYLVDPTDTELSYEYVHVGDTQDIMWAERGLCYEPTEEGKQAAILHAKAWLGIHPE